MKLSNLEQLIGLNDSNQLPPVESWQPQLNGDMDMVIRADGSWWHEGEKIEREKLVRLFASILRKEGDEYFLLTPVEKWRIQVEDCPFVITMIERTHAKDNIAGNDSGHGIIEAITNTGDLLVLSSLRPLEAMAFPDDAARGESVPVIEVRNGLKARFSRNAYYNLAELAEERDGGFYVCSRGDWLQIN